MTAKPVDAEAGIFRKGFDGLLLFRLPNRKLDTAATVATALLVVDYMCMRFTGVTLAELKEGMENANPNPGEPEATGSDDTGVVVEAGNVIKPHEAA